jgi:hypothetical protein
MKYETVSAKHIGETYTDDADEYREHTVIVTARVDGLMIVGAVVLVVTEDDIKPASPEPFTRDGIENHETACSCWAFETDASDSAQALVEHAMLEAGIAACREAIA